MSVPNFYSMSSSKNGLKWGFLRGQKPNEIVISFELKIHIKNQKTKGTISGKLLV